MQTLLTPTYFQAQLHMTRSPKTRCCGVQCLVLQRSRTEQKKNNRETFLLHLLPESSSDAYIYILFLGAPSVSN